MTNPIHPVDVKLVNDGESLFVGSYAPLALAIHPESGLRLDDLDFVVPDGLAGGLVTVASGPDADPERSGAILLAGYVPGAYLLEVRVRRTAELVGQLRYEVVDDWNDDTAGPSRWFSGSQALRTTGSAVGWGDPNTPQNLDVFSTAGTRKIAILFVEAGSESFPAGEMAAIRDRWLDEVTRGVPGPHGVPGVEDSVRSCDAWYREVSYRKFNLTAEAFGPVQISSPIMQYFDSLGFRPEYPQQCMTAAVTAGIAGSGKPLDLTKFHTLLLVSRQVPPTGTTPKWGWPQASRGNVGALAVPGSPAVGVISMADYWGTQNNHEAHESASHELGHNLSLNDQYDSTRITNIGSWDIMGSDDWLPHFTLVHRMMLGWIKPEWIRLFNLGQGGHVEDTVTLSAVERGEPPVQPAGQPKRYVGIEIRIENGRNYYLEFRYGKSPDIGDRQLEMNKHVVLTEFRSPPYTLPLAERPLQLPKDDSRNPVLKRGQNYIAPGLPGLTPTDPLRIDVTSIDDTKAKVKISYTAVARPELTIAPAPASPSEQWRSPDIEVRNARSEVDETWLNVPWPGNPNTIVAKVHNVGELSAPAVHVDFYVMAANIGGAEPEPIGSDVNDVEAGATVEFRTTWVPPGRGAFSVMARIRPYDPPGGPAPVEWSETGHRAESAYDRFDTTFSPSTRKVATYTVTNPYQEPTRVTVVAGQTNPLYRTLIDHTWLRLEPGQTRAVTVTYEFALDPRRDGLPPDVRLGPSEVARYQLVPNRVALHTQIDDPTDPDGHRVEIFSGAQALVTTGRATRIDEFSAEGRQVRGTVVTLDSGDRVFGGTVLVTVDPDTGRPEDYEYASAPVRDGLFTVELSRGWRAVRADFLPPQGYGPSTTDWLFR